MKTIIITVEDTENAIFGRIMSVLNDGKNIFKADAVQKFEKLTFSDFTIDICRRVIERKGQDIYLTFIEFEILHLLARNPGKVFSKEQIYDIVWKEPYSGDYNIVMSHIRNIREKIEDNPSKPVYIQTVWGVGYRFNQNISSGL